VLPDEGLLGPALRHVDGPAELRPILAALLRHVLLAEGRESALRFLESEAHAGRRVVTLDGEEFGPGTCARGGVRGAGSRILERRVERDEVEVQLRGARETLLRAERELEAAERQARELADGVEALRRSAEEAHGETRTATFQREELDRSVAREEEELRLGSDERRALEEAWRAQRERLEARGRDEAELERKVQEARDQAARAGARRDALDRTLRELEEERGRASAGRSAGQARREGLKRSLEAAERALREGREGLTLLRMELEALAERERKLQTEAEEARQEAGRLEAARPEAAALVQERHAEGEELETGVASWEGLVQKLEEGALGAREELEGLRVREGQLDVRREELVTRLREETGLDLLTAPPAEAATIDPEAMDAEIADLRRKLEPYKNVNLEAIDQLKEVEERLRFLVEQEGDLTRSRDTLEDVIRDIQTRCRDLFDQTFTEVRENFRVLFRKFFGGGNADLVLLQPEEPLESGIEIVAQPPGKGAKSIDLLSGGEKTMTAIAVLFALFQAKPSPFCILDEVDAALDESNIGRFLLVLQAFLDRSQFLIITHNKKTMAIADVLYGITMETQGRSKRVAVEFRERAAPVGAVPVSAGDGNGNGSGNGHGDVVAP
jgi:chromosome segregation protein